MPTTSGPFSRPTFASDTGLGWAVSISVGVFLLGMVIVGLIYLLAGQRVETTESVATAPPAAAPAATAPAQTQPGTPADDSAPPPATPPSAPVNDPSASPAGRSPLPMPGEGDAPPMPATRLIDRVQYEAPPAEPSTLPAPEGPVSWTEAHNYLGQTITVKGTIVDTNNIGQICFLNYDPNWQDKFYIAMFKEAFDLLPDPPEQHYLNKTLLVTGKVTLHGDRPQIQVRDVSQIEVVE
jgi:hypothetical protein